MIKVKTQYDYDATIISWYMLKNGWEYYQLESADKDGIAYGFVMGDSNEFGTFSLNEIKPYIWVQAHGQELQEIALPEGWKALAGTAVDAPVS